VNGEHPTPERRGHAGDLIGRLAEVGQCQQPLAEAFQVDSPSENAVYQPPRLFTADMAPLPQAGKRIENVGGVCRSIHGNL
jgi:hypothetical protein